MCDSLRLNQNTVHSVHYQYLTIISQCKGIWQMYFVSCNDDKPQNTDCILPLYFSIYFPLNTQPKLVHRWSRWNNINIFLMVKKTPNPIHLLSIMAWIMEQLLLRTFTFCSRCSRAVHILQIQICMHKKNHTTYRFLPWLTNCYSVTGAPLCFSSM